ncbi:MAG TPA: NAD(P)-dependent oxidoreductase [Capillimicrobium sp.]|nr:NAD(P)-dependent oxidoreductase [Capillimicrobium sp.]
MRVFVAGGTGAIGRPLVAQLVARGHDVVATTRSAAKAGELRALGADAVVVDGLDAAAVREAVVSAAPDAIVHQMTALSGTPDLRRFDRWFAATNALRTRGTRNLLDAAQAAGVRRFVAQSYTGWPNARTGGPVKTEDDPLDPDPAPAQRETAAAIRFVEEAVTAAPLDGVVLRYGGFYGPGASESLVELVRKRRLPIVGAGGGVWSWLHVDDAASATVAALESDATGIFNVVDDDPAPVAQWLPDLAQVVGAKPPRHVPVWVGRLLGGEAVVRMMTEARGSSNAKIKRELGWQPRYASWRDGFRHGLTRDGERNSPRSGGRDLPEPPGLRGAAHG